MAHISPALRQTVMKRALLRCEYCLSAQLITGEQMHIEHIYPESLGGATELHNLACACSRCNAHKGIRIRFRDWQTNSRVTLFNPRRQRWGRHFQWSEDGLRIIGQTRVGRATVEALNMNSESIVRARLHWVRFGIHPPQD